MAEEESQPAQENAEEVLASVQAYFELLKGWQVPITLETEGGVEAEGLVEALEPGRRRLTLSIRNAPPAGLEPNDAVKLYFGMEDARWMGTTKILHHRGNRRSFVMPLPRRLEAEERRKAHRARNLEGITVLLRPGEFNGEAYHGTVVDLSEGGLQMRVERSGGVLSEAEGELREGQDLALIRVSGLGRTELEAAGLLIHMNRTKSGLLVGVRFRNLKNEERKTLETFLKPLIVEPPTVLPILGQPAVPNLVVGMPAPGEPETGEARSDALLRLKKRGRTLLVAMPSGPEREGVVTFLLGAGYGRILTAGTLSEIMEILSSALPMHAVLIDGGVAELKGVELATFFHHAKEEDRCPIFLVEADFKGNGQSQALQAGVARVLPTPYLTPELLALLEEELDLRPKEEVPDIPSITLAPPVRGRIMRRLRAVAVVMPPGVDRDRLATFLTLEGFTRVLLAGTVAELVRALQSTTLALAFIDWPEADVQGLEIASFLSESYTEGKLALVVAAAQPSPRLIQDAHAIGVAQVLLKPYVLDAMLADLLGAYLEEHAP